MKKYYLDEKEGTGAFELARVINSILSANFIELSFPIWSKALF